MPWLTWRCPIGASPLKFQHHLAWNHVWDCLVITDLRPIFSHLCSPLISLFGAHTVWRGMMNTWLSKAHMLGVLFFLSHPPQPPPHTHTHTEYTYIYSTTVPLRGVIGAIRINGLHPAVQPTSTLKKSCITTPSLKTGNCISCCWVICWFFLLFFKNYDKPLLSISPLFLSFLAAARLQKLLPTEWLKKKRS